jgi:Ca-activated chloride channel family protein
MIPEYSQFQHDQRYHHKQPGGPMIATEPRITEGTLKTSDGRPLPLESTSIKGTISGPLASVELRQKFRNTTSETIEATYLFPLSHHASVYHMEFRLDDRVVTGVVKEKEEARRTYETARAEGRAATLLEQERPNLFTLSVANIAPGASIEVFLKYQELVTYDAGEWRFVFPLVASERYHGGEATDAKGGTTQVADGSRIRPPRARRKDRSSPVSVEFHIQDCGPISAPGSPSHQLSVKPLDNGYRLSLAEGAIVPNRDFILAWRAAVPGPQEHLAQLAPRIWFDRQEDKPGTFCLYLPAPAVPKPSFSQSKPGPAGSLLCGNCGAPMVDKDAVQQVEGFGPAWKCEYCGVMHAVKAPDGQSKTTGKDVLFLIDRSGSTGASDLGAEAIRKTLELLSPDDNFKIVAFHHELKHFQDDWVACTEGAVSRATEFLVDLPCKGGTEMDLVLKLATQDARPDRSQVVVLITDGAVGNEARFLKQISDSFTDSRLYVLGVGPAPNRYLIEKMAQMGRGAFDVSTVGESGTVERFAQRVAQAAPVLSEVQLKWLEGMGVDMYPNRDLELFAGKSLCVVGRFVGAGPGRLELRGTTSEGKPFVQILPCLLPDTASTPGLERVWAGRRVDDLQDQLLKRPERLSEIRLEVLGLALKHSLVTPYTALVAEDSEQAVDPKAPSRTVQVESPRPAPRAGGGPGGPPVAACGMAPPAPVPAALDFMPVEAESLCFDAAPEPVSCEEAPPSPPATRSRKLSFGGLFRKSEGSSGKPVLGGHVKGGSGSPSKPILSRKRAPSPQVPGSQQPVVQPRHHNYTPDELDRARELIQGSLDLVFLIDETGSMGRYIAQVQAHLLKLIETVRKSPLCSHLRLGLVTFRDHPPQDNSFVTRVVPLTETVDDIAQGVKRMVADGGGDAPEAVTDGLMELLYLNWNPGSTRLVVMVGDAPPHGVMPQGDGFPDGCPCGRHWYTQAESCREMNIVVHTVGCRGIDHFAGAEEVFKAVAQRTGGLYLPLKDANLLIGLVSGLADRELDRKRVEGFVREVCHQHIDELLAADLDEQIRFLTETLQARKVRVLDFSDEKNQSLKFREIRKEDVELAWDTVYREIRSSVPQPYHLQSASQSG